MNPGLYIAELRLFFIKTSLMYRSKGLNCVVTFITFPGHYCDVRSTVGVQCHWLVSSAPAHKSSTTFEQIRSPAMTRGYE